MQLCALNRQDELVFAAHAVKHIDYSCMECRQKVRVRRGMQRQAHYYHLQPNQACRQNGKTLEHLMAQYYLKEKLPAEGVFLEHRFDAIRRIADVAWISQKIVFEIQCSPISAEEIEARNRDYASLGFHVIWIFHENRFNQEKLTSAEDVLQDLPHYFTDIDEEGVGGIYDHFSLVKEGERKFRLTKQLIDPSKMRGSLSANEWEKLRVGFPEALFQRTKKWKRGFAGDCVDSYLRLEANFINKLEELSIAERLYSNEEDLLSQPLGRVAKGCFQRWVVVPYRSVLRLFLEKACR